MNNLKQEKKDYLISILKKYGEYSEDIDWENIDSNTIDEIYEALITDDKTKRNEIINSYKKREINNIKKQRKDAEDLLLKTQKLSNSIKEKKSEIKDNKNIENLESQIENMEI